MRRPLNRITPKLPVTAVRTYQISAPLATHYRRATCEEVGCAAQEFGWRTTVDERTELGQRQAHYIRRESRRTYIEERDPSGLTVFTFEPGQRCFAQHHVSLDRPAHYLRRAGDWRGNPLGEVYRHTSAESWLDDFMSNQDALATRLARG